MASLASLVSLGSAGASSSGHFEGSLPLQQRVFLSRRSFRGGKRWGLVSVCKYSGTMSNVIAEEGNAVSVDSSTYRGGGKDEDNGLVLKPAPKPVLKSVNSVVSWDSGTKISGDSDNDDDEKLENVDERSKVIESLGEVLEKAEKLETGGRDGGYVDKSPPSTSSNSRIDRTANNSNSSKKSKTLKSVWRKGNPVATVQKVVKDVANDNTTNTEREGPVGRGKVEPQPRIPLRPTQPPLSAQPKLQARPSVAPPPPVLKKPVILKDVGAAPKSSVVDETNSAKPRERKPILIDKFSSKKPAVDQLIAQAVLAPPKPGKGPVPGKFKDDYRKKGAPSGGLRRRMVANDIEIPDEETSELNVSIPGAVAARKGRKWSKASRKAARLQAAKDAAPVKVEILEVGEEGMLTEDLSYNLAISEGEILGFLYSKGIRPDGVQTLDKDMVKMICKEYDVEVIEAAGVKVEEMARKKEFLDEEDLDKLESRPPVLTIMGHVDHGKVSEIALFALFFGHAFLSYEHILVCFREKRILMARFC